ncbi:F-box protein SKIP28 [Bienertia sinuspersici]
MEVEEVESPHEAIFFVLAYLPLQELLLMTQVSKSFRDVVRDDVLVWLNIVVERPLSLRLTNEILIKIASKAHGMLHSLALLNCVKITDEGLLNVVNANPLITKLYVAGCTGLTPDGVVMAVKTLVAKPTSTTLRRVKMSGLYNMKKEHLWTLKSCIPIPQSPPRRKPRFYHKYTSSSYSSINEEDDARPIDVEICPKCKEVKLVFDCPNEAECKGCFDCISRCKVCGRCCNSDMDDDEQGDTICNDIVCLDCWLRLPKCNHCNKPFCPQHADTQLIHPTSKGFICQICITNSLAFAFHRLD